MKSMSATDKLETMYLLACKGELNESSPAIKEHLPTLRGLSVGTVVEFGAEFGNSTVAFITGSAEKVISVDIKITDELKNISSLSEKHSYLEDSSLVVEIPECDVLFIDSLHTYDQLSKELELHHKKVRGRIIMHDTEIFKSIHIYDGKEGLARAILEFLDKNKEWDVEKIYKNNNGLTILKRNI